MGRANALLVASTALSIILRGGIGLFRNAVEDLADACSLS